jgi:hypothetical protein
MGGRMPRDSGVAERFMNPAQVTRPGGTVGGLMVAIWTPAICSLLFAGRGTPLPTTVRVHVRWWRIAGKFVRAALKWTLRGVR